MKNSTKSRLTALTLAALTLLSAFSLASCSEDDWYPAGMQLASDEGADYRLWVPQEWTVDISTGVASAYASDRTNVSLVAFNLRDDPTISPADYWANHYELLKATFPDIVLENEGEQINISDTLAMKYVYTASVTGISYRYTQIFIVRAGYVYIMTFTQAAESETDHSVYFDAIVEEFQFTDEQKYEGLVGETEDKDTAADTSAAE